MGHREIWCEKNALQAALFVVGCYAKSGKDFLKNPDFPAWLPARLIEINSAA